MAGQKVQKLKLHIFDYTFGTFAAWTHSEGFADPSWRLSRDCINESLPYIHTLNVYFGAILKGK